MQLTEEIIKYISESKEEPLWMLEFRLKSFRLFKNMKMPKWQVPNLSIIDFDDIDYYNPPGVKATSWEDVPADIKEIYDNIGVPKAEREFLIGGSIAQFQSETIYEKLHDNIRKQGVIFTSMDNALREHPELFRRYFGKIVPPINNKFSALHYAVWSGGSFLYVPKGVKVNVPLHIFFYMRNRSEGQFEHTLLIGDNGSAFQYIEGCAAPLYDKHSLHASAVEVHVGRNSRVRYTTMQNWSKNVINLATKRANVYKDGQMSWITGSIGSKIVMAYPSLYLMEENASGEVLSVGIANKEIIKEEGAKAYHLAPNTKSNILSKSISINGGNSIYRGLVYIDRGAYNSYSSVKCDSILIGEGSKAESYPNIISKEKRGVSYNHEAKAGKISSEVYDYLSSRGYSEEQITQMYVLGYLKPFMEELSLEYVIELTKLLKMEVKECC